VAAGQDTAAGHKRKNDSQNIGLQTSKKMTTAVGLLSPRQDEVNWHLVSRCFEQLFLLEAQQTNNFQIPTKEVHGFLMYITRQWKDKKEIKWEGMPKNLKPLENKFRKLRGLTVDTDTSERGSEPVLRFEDGQIYIHQGETFAILCELYTAGAYTEEKLRQKTNEKYRNIPGDVLKLFLSVISFHNNLWRIPSSAGGVRWDPPDEKRISFPSLRKLNLSGVGLDKGAAERLAEGLTQLRNLEDLSVRDNRICVNGLLMLEDVIISSSKMLVTVDFAGNLINDEEAGLVSTQFKLQCPHMQHTIVKADGVKTLQCCIKVNGRVYRITENPRVYLCESMPNTRTIGDVSQELSELDGTLQRSPEGLLNFTTPESDIPLSESAHLEMLQRMLPGCKVESFMEKFVIHSQIIASKLFSVRWYHSLGQYAKAIELFEQSFTIAEEVGDRVGQGNDYNNLGLAHNQIGNAGAESLAEVLAQCTALAHLDLRYQNKVNQHTTSLPPTRYQRTHARIHSKMLLNSTARLNRALQGLLGGTQYASICIL
jgi:hypothetical protein